MCWNPVISCGVERETTNWILLKCSRDQHYSNTGSIEEIEFQNSYVYAARVHNDIPSGTDAAIVHSGMFPRVFYLIMSILNCSRDKHSNAMCWNPVISRGVERGSTTEYYSSALGTNITAILVLLGKLNFKTATYVYVARVHNDIPSGTDLPLFPQAPSLRYLYILSCLRILRSVLTYDDTTYIRM